MSFLDYFSLAVLILGLTMAFYGFIYIHDIPYQIAKKRQHPQTEAIHVACWLSLFTLHAIWPIVFIWAIMKQRPFAVSVAASGEADPSGRIGDLERRLAALESAADAESAKGASAGA